MDLMKHHISKSIEAMLGEIKTAEMYLHAATKCENMENKKIYATMSKQELHHFDELKKMFDEDVKKHPNEIMIDNNIVAKTLLDKVMCWKKEVHEGLEQLLKENNISI